MPVDEDINLDNPDGLTREDIEILKREAEEVALYAENAEENAKKIKKAREETEKLDFTQRNLILEGPANKDAVGGLSSPNTMNMEQLQMLIINILEQMKRASKERAENSRKLKEAEMERAMMEKEIKSIASGAESKFNEFLSATSNPIQFGKGKLLTWVAGAGVVGAITMIIYRVVDRLWNEYLKSFQAGGANDVRKLMDDRSKEMMELKDILDRRAGRVFYTGDVDLRQGAPQMSNTERLRDQVLRYEALHLGE